MAFLTKLVLVAVAAPSLVLASVNLEARDTMNLPCSQPNIPFNYVGCYVDPSVQRPLTFDPQLPSNNMTIEACTAACRDNGYRYAGLEYYFQCFCGASVTGPGLSLDPTSCSYACTGNPVEICGGNDYMSIYEDPDFAPIDNTTISDYFYQGCYTDADSNGRAIAYRQDQLNVSTMTVETCLQACKNGGFSHAGLEYYGECYCGVILSNSSVPALASDCNTPCNGNALETCGGSSRISYYVAQDLQAAPLCSTSIPTTTMPVATTSSTSSTSTTSSTPAATTTTSTTTSTTKSTTTTTLDTSTLPTCTSAPSSSTPACEYSCGSWCSTPLPPWSGTGSSSWGPSFASCDLQILACFIEAGWPAAQQCWSFANWCSKLQSGSYADKASFLSQCPPAGNSAAASISTSTGKATCIPSTSTSSSPTTTMSTTVTPPTASNVCILPRGQSVGAIQPPYVSCNDDYSDWGSGNWFKLYSTSDHGSCPSYSHGQLSNACQKACQYQYAACYGTYAQSCKNMNTGVSYNTASQQCQSQYQACLQANQNLNPGNRCSSWGGGWS